MTTYSRSLPVVWFLSLVAIASTASAQCSASRSQPMFAGQFPAAYAGSLSSMPSIGQMASQSSLQSSAAVPTCSAQREAQLQRIAMMQQRRDAEKARRQSARQKLPTQPVVLDSEQQAAAKYELSHSLWLAGRPDAARKWLGEILDNFPTTQTADRARQTLAAL